jgi:hypothetical protein
MKRIFRFLKSLIRYIFTGHVQNVTFEEYARRIDICSKCDKINQYNYTCGVCGCYMDKKAKWSTEHCDDEKW